MCLGVFFGYFVFFVGENKTKRKIWGGAFLGVGELGENFEWENGNKIIFGGDFLLGGGEVGGKFCGEK